MLCLSGFELYSGWVPLKSGQLLMKLICRENTDYEFTRVFLLKKCISNIFAWKNPLKVVVTKHLS